jgi:hypothetical protein
MALAVTSDRCTLAESRIFSQRELNIFADTIADVPQPPHRDDIIAVTELGPVRIPARVRSRDVPDERRLPWLDRASKLTFRRPSSPPPRPPSPGRRLAPPPGALSPSYAPGWDAVTRLGDL